MYLNALYDFKSACHQSLAKAGNDVAFRSRQMKGELKALGIRLDEEIWNVVVKFSWDV